jgi:hypothetical protein
VASDSRFRAAVRERLVVLPQNCPGLAVKVSGRERAVVVFPREGKIGSGASLLNFVWLSVEINDDAAPLEFRAMGREDVLGFLTTIVLKS